MKKKKANEKIGEFFCQTALNVAHRTVENNGKYPICTIIIYQPDVPENCKKIQNIEEEK